jgi:hypothetical protein
MRPDADPALLVAAYNGLYLEGEKAPITEEDARWYLEEKAAHALVDRDLYLRRPLGEEEIILHIRRRYGINEPLTADADPAQFKHFFMDSHDTALELHGLYLTYRAAVRYVEWKRAGMPPLD